MFGGGVETKQGETSIFLSNYIQLADKSSTFPLQKAANTIRTHWSGILS
jgi:hypothetical protein